MRMIRKLMNISNPYIKLTLYNNGFPIYIKANSISSFYEVEGSKTEVRDDINKTVYVVKENPEEIHKLLRG